MRASGKLFTTAALATACCALARPANADIDYQIAAGAGAMWMSRVPTLRTEAVSSSAREHGETNVSPGGSLVGLGGSFDIALTVDDRWIVPVVGIGAYGAVGSYDSVVTSADGSIARVRPWSAYQVDVLLPGLGYRWKRRRFMFGATLRAGGSVLEMGGSVAAGNEEKMLSLAATSFRLQAELEACRRLDPVTRVCLQVAPRLYDHGVMNGAVFGLRVEWGR